MTMHKTKEITVTLPEDLTGKVEREIQKSGESLDTFFRRAAELLLAKRRDEEMTQQY